MKIVVTFFSCVLFRDASNWQVRDASKWQVKSLYSTGNRE
jgi:hypothetical protein